MKYRVILEIGYSEAWFEFQQLMPADEFARDILTHIVQNEDNVKKSATVKIEVIDPEVERMSKKELIDKIKEIQNSIVEDSKFKDDRFDAEVAESYVDDFAEMIIDFINNNWNEDANE